MKYFDALFSVQPIDGEEQAFYLVRTYREDSLEVARRKAEARSRKPYRAMGCELCRMRLLNVAPAGSFDQFVGKYVGQFIDEAFASNGRS